jgi:hypothetical protein
MTDYSSARLLYRGTRDGFSAAVFRRNGSFPNTVTLIKSNKNYVFGGFTSISLNRSNGWYTDPTAFIFSLRRNGTINNVQLRSGGTANDASAQYAIYISSSYLNIQFCFRPPSAPLCAASASVAACQLTHSGTTTHRPLRPRK